MTDYDYALGGGAVLRFTVVQTSQDIATNQSVDNWSLALFKGSFSPWTTDPIPWAISINEVPYSGSFTFDFTVETTHLIAAGSTPVPHNADGTKTTRVAAYMDDTGTSVGGPLDTGSLYFPQTTIPRASTPTFKLAAGGGLITECDAGIAIEILTNRASASFTHKIEYQIGATGWQTIAASGVGTSYTPWTIPLSLLNQIPAALTGTLQFRVTTYTNSGATLIGSTITNFTMKAGAAIVPDLGTITHSEATTVPAVASLIGAYVQGITKLNVAISSPAGIYGSTITNQKVEVVGQSGNQVVSTGASPLSSVLPAFLAASGTVTLRATVTDSRGRTYSEDVSITVLAYAIPNLVAPLTVQRALSGGTPDEAGTYIRSNINAAVQSLIVAAVQKNAITYRISTSPHGANTWTVKTTTSPGGLTFNSHHEVGTYVISSSFDVKIEVYDKLAALAQVLVIATSAVPFHIGVDGVGIGKFNEGLADLEVAGDIMSAGDIVVTIGDVATTTNAGVVSELATGAETAALTDPARVVTPLGLASFLPIAAPPGGMIPYGGDTAPSGWLLCDGAAVSRSTYAALFDAINASLGTFTVTIASPGVFTRNSHGLKAGDRVWFSTTGALPTGLTAGTEYFVISASLAANTFRVSATRGGAAVNTSGSQSGTHTLRKSPHGVGNGTSTFNLPSMKDQQRSCRVTKSSAQNTSGTPDTLTAVTWSAQSGSSPAMWSSGANTKIFPDRRGLWRVAGKVRVAQGGGYAYASVRMNGAANTPALQVNAAAAVDPFPFSEDTFVVTDPGVDYFELWVGASSATQALSTTYCSLHAEYIGPLPGVADDVPMNMLVKT